MRMAFLLKQMSRVNGCGTSFFDVYQAFVPVYLCHRSLRFWFAGFGLDIWMQINSIDHTIHCECVGRVNFFEVMIWNMTRIFNINFSLPWNQSTILGYFGEIFFVVASCDMGLLVNATTLIIFISICLHLCAFYTLFKYMIVDWNHCHPNRLQKRQKRFFCNLVRFHISVEKLV